MKNTCVVKVSSELDKSKVTAVRNGKDIRVNWSKVNHAESYVVTRYNKLTANDEVIYEGTQLHVKIRICLQENMFIL